MFHDIPESVRMRMLYLEDIDSRDRQDGTPHQKRLRQVPPETGRFIALLAASAPQGAFVEIGTSAGYSTLWLALACRQSGRSITTYEVLEDKVQLARETFQQAGVDDVVELVRGDARSYLASMDRLAFCFLDAEKDVYQECYEAIIPRLVTGGLLLADNAINHKQALGPMLGRAQEDVRVDALIVPIGKGVLVCRKV
jgi:caffeoyl-CoA O-methyltransferase